MTPLVSLIRSLGRELEGEDARLRGVRRCRSTNVKSGRLRSLLFGGSCGKEEQRALHRLEAQEDRGLPHPAVDRPQDRGDHAEPQDDEQTDEHTPDAMLARPRRRSIRPIRIASAWANSVRRYATSARNGNPSPSA